MAERFRAYLSAFSNIFRTDGNLQLPSMLDLSSPVSPVVDLSRIAQRGAYFATSMAKTVPAAPGGDTYDIQYASSFTDALTAVQLPEQLEAWVVQVACLVQNAAKANFTSAHMGFKQDVQPSNDKTQYVYPFKTWNATASVIPNGGDYVPAIIQRDYGVTLPFRLGRDPLSATTAAGIYTRITGTDTCVVRFLVTLWIGPRGGTPPGVS